MESLLETDGVRAWNVREFRVGGEWTATFARIDVRTPRPTVRLV